MQGKVIQINVKPKTQNEVGLPKKPVESAYFSKMNVGNDYNTYRMSLSREKVDNRTVLVYPNELIKQLNSEHWPLQAGDLGENVTTEGIPYEEFKSGSKFKIGKALIQITEQANPCSNLSSLSYVGEEKITTFIKTMLGRRGMYAKVLVEGEVFVGDPIIKTD